MADLLSNPSPPLREEREGPIAKRWEGEVGVSASALESPTLTPALSAPRGGEGGVLRRLSPPLEIGQAAVGVGLDAFLEILGAAQTILLDQLAFGRRFDLVDEAAADGLARGEHRERRGLRDFEGQRLGGG